MKRLLLIFMLLAGLAAVSQTIPAKPNPPRLVNDLAQVMSADEVESLEKKLVAYDDTSSVQIAIVTVQTLGEVPIEDYALKILRDWGIGNKKTNNGVLIVAAIQDHKLRIETGYGLEGSIPDALAKNIIDNELAPSFRSGNYYEGFNKASDAIILASRGEYKAPAGYNKRGRGSDGSGIGIIIFIIIIIILIAIRSGGRGNGGVMNRSGFFPWLVINSLLNSGGGGGGWGGGGGGGGFGGGGGGFGGFGGGGGGGGGASGGW